MEGGLFLSLPVGDSKSETDQEPVGAVCHPAADSFIVSRLAGRAVDEGGGEEGGGVRMGHPHLTTVRTKQMQALVPEDLKEDGCSRCRFLR